MIIRQSTEGGVYAKQDENVIFLSDDDISRMVQVRFCLSHLSFEDLAKALDAFQQIPYSQVCCDCGAEDKFIVTHLETCPMWRAKR